MKKICSVLPMILALGLSAGVMTAFRACPRGDEGMWMHCHDAQILIFVIGLFMAAAAAGSAMLRRFGMIFAITGMAAAASAYEGGNSQKIRKRISGRSIGKEFIRAAGNHWHAGRSARRGSISKNCL